MKTPFKTGCNGRVSAPPEKRIPIKISYQYKMKERIRDALRRMGVEIGGYRHTFLARRQCIFSAYGVDTVVDVGANVGQYARMIRRGGFGGRIISFEPLTVAFDELAKCAAVDPKWDCRRVAVGAKSGNLDLNVSVNSIFTSARPLTPKSLETDLATRILRVESVAVEPLDALINPSPNTAVKIDVQGYEDQVVAGGSEVIGAAPVVEMEITMTPLYEEQWLIRDALAVLEDRFDLELALTENIMPDPETGRALQINGLFVRNRIYSRSEK